ncbi:MAG: hypothetical protein NVSMB24_11770 [Mucilaginibacter sp.]
MKISIYRTITGLIFFLATTTGLKAQTSPGTAPSLGPSNPWMLNQLMEPNELAAVINSPHTGKPVIFNIGAVEDIKDAKHIGAVSKTETLKSFKKALYGLPKDTKIVIYCGCCPFAKCPNIRPAFSMLTGLGFTNIKLLNLPVNLKTNWRDKGYPMEPGR